MFVCPCLLWAATDQQHQGIKFIFCTKPVCDCVLTCSVPLWAQRQAGWGTWPVVWSRAVRWRNRERRDRASWWNETDGVHGSHDDPSGKKTHTHTHGRDVSPQLHILQLQETIVCHFVSWWWWMHGTHESSHGPFGIDWQEDISWFSSLFYSRDFRNLGAIQPLWLQFENKSISWLSRRHFGPLLGMRDRKTYRRSFA